MPITWSSKRQTSTSTTTQEAELTSLHSGMKDDGIPIQILMEFFMGCAVPVSAMEDNDSTLKAVCKGYSPALRAFHRTHSVHVGWLRGIFHVFEFLEQEGSYDLLYARTDTHKGDPFTKALSPDPFAKAMRLLGLCFS